MAEDNLDAEHRITDKMPLWARWILQREGIPPTFKLSRLAEEQKAAFVMVVELAILERNGLLRVEFGEEGPSFHLTEKGSRKSEELKRG